MPLASEIDHAGEFRIFGMSVALCMAMVAKNVTVRLGGIVLDPIGASTFAAVLLNLAIVLVKQISPFAEVALAAAVSAAGPRVATTAGKRR